MGIVKLWPLIEFKPLNRLRSNFAQLITSTRRTRTRNPNLCKSAVRERLAKYVKYKVSLFYFYFFSNDSPTEVTRSWNFACDVSKHALWRKEVPFWGPHDGGQHFGVQIPPKPSKMAFYKHVWASVNRLKTNDVIEDWRHWLRYVAACRRGRAAYTTAVYFQVIKHYIRHRNSVLASVYSICRQSVVQGVA